MLLPSAPVSPTQVCCKSGMSCRPRTEMAAPASTAAVSQVPGGLAQLNPGTQITVPNTSHLSPLPITLLSQGPPAAKQVPLAHLSDIGNEVLPEGQAAPDEPHGYDVMSQAHNVLIEPVTRRKGKCQSPSQGTDMLELETRVRGSRATEPSWLSAPRGLATATRVSQNSLGGIGIWQRDGKHTRVLLCCEVPVEVRQPGQSCNTGDRQ